MTRIKSRWLSSLVAGIFAFAMGTVLAQVSQRPLDPNTGKSAGITYFREGSEPASAADGELAIRSRAGQVSELVFFDRATGAGWTSIGTLSPAAGSGTTNTIPKFNAAGELEDTDITEVAGNFIYQGGSFSGRGTGIAALQGDIGVTLTGGAGAPGPADIFATADDNINLIAFDDINFTADTFTSDTSVNTFLNSDGAVRLATTDNQAFIQVNEAGGGGEISLQTTEANSGIILNAGGTLGTVNISSIGNTSISADGNVVIDGINSGSRIQLDAPDGVRLAITNQGGLGTPVDGTVMYCTDCNPDATCTAAGAGAFAFRINGAFACELN